MNFQFLEETHVFLEFFKCLQLFFYMVRYNVHGSPQTTVIVATGCPGTTARHWWYSWTLRPGQQCVIFCGGDLGSLEKPQLLYCCFYITSCVFMSPLLEMYTRCAAFRIQVALMNEAPLETESKSTWHDYGSHRTEGLHHASIRQNLIPCLFYVESM